MKDIRPGDVWEEVDGDVCFIVEMDHHVDEWFALAYYPANSYDPRWDRPVETYRRDNQLSTLLYRQEDLMELSAGEYVIPASKIGRWETKDSGERDVTDSGYQRDTERGKPRFDFLLPVGIPYDQQMLTRVASLLARGASKYGPRNWEKSDVEADLGRFKSSGLRHMLQWLTGEDDEDHASAVIFNIIAHETIAWKLAQDKDA